MATTTVRVSEKSRDMLRALSQQTGESIGAIIDEAVEQYRRRRILEQTAEDYKALREDPVAWADWQEEIRRLDGTLMDGLSDYE